MSELQGLIPVYKSIPDEVDLFFLHKVLFELNCLQKKKYL